MKCILSITAVAMILCQFQTEGSPPSSITNLTLSAGYQLSPTNVSELAKSIVAQLSGTTLAVRASALPLRSHGSLPGRDYETVNIAPPLGMCDGFSHTLFIDPATKEFWVLRTGGFAGKHELFGPGTIISPNDEAIHTSIRTSLMRRLRR